VRSERRRASDAYGGLITSCHSKTELTAPCEWAKRVTMSPRAIASIEAQRWGGRWGPLQDRGCRFSSPGSSFIRSWWSVRSSRAPAVIPTEVEGSRPVLRAQGTTSAKPARSVVRSMVPCAPQTGARSLDPAPMTVGKTLRKVLSTPVALCSAVSLNAATTEPSQRTLSGAAQSG